MAKRIVIALGGNALGKNLHEQMDAVNVTAKAIADMIEEGYELVIAHGNGPQVGRIVLQNESASNVTPAMPFDVCGAMSQGYIGYHIQQGLSKILLQRGIDKQVVTLVTQVVVDKNDPKFQNPSKPIGPFYTKAEAEKIALEKGYAMKEDAGRGYRRVVASPLPVRIVELDAVKALESAGFVVVTVGGGGIPVIQNEDGTLTGTAAVIDKDLASEKLAEDLDADALVERAKALFLKWFQILAEEKKHARHHFSWKTFPSTTRSRIRRIFPCSAWRMRRSISPKGNLPPDPCCPRWRRP